MEFPVFKYHPNPIDTGAVERSTEKCACCQKARGFRATSTIYAIEDVETICPWCIADGTAASKFDGEFSDPHPLLKDGIEKHIVREVCERTPSFISWQQERWLSHCNDACEFHGDADKEDLESLNEVELEDFLKQEYLQPDVFEAILSDYEKGGNPAVYKFKCRACGKLLFSMDYT